MARRYRGSSGSRPGTVVVLVAGGAARRRHRAGPAGRPVTCGGWDRRHGFDVRLADAGQPDGFSGFGSSAVSPNPVADRIHNAVTCAFLRLKRAGK
jgi:hypothetical protein